MSGTDVNKKSKVIKQFLGCFAVATSCMESDTVNVVSEYAVTDKAGTPKMQTSADSPTCLTLDGYNAGASPPVVNRCRAANGYSS